MEKDWKIANSQILLLIGFLFFALGTLGVIQIGFLEGLTEIIPLSVIILLIGIIFLIISLLMKPNSEKKTA